jgi:hypothetical protein
MVRVLGFNHDDGRDTFLRSVGLYEYRISTQDVCYTKVFISSF